jgi:hypothetical protein
MWFSSVLCWPQGTRKSTPRDRPQPRPGRRYRPALEQLEDRWAPAQFTNPATLTIPGGGTVGPAAPYPSTIEVAGLPGTAGKVTVTLHNISHDAPDVLDILLVAPNGANIILLSDVGGDKPVSNLTLTLDAAAAEGLPDDGPLVSGTFLPTNMNDGHPDFFPAPAPAPSGTVVLLFPGVNPNGPWSLYVNEDGNASGTIAGGWTLDFVGVRFPTVTAVSAAPSPALVGQAVTLTATVTGPGNPTGMVTFRDGTAVLGTAPVSGGRAVLTGPGLGPGAHAITAAFNGDANNFLSSTSAPFVLTVHEQITAAQFQRNGVSRVRVRGATSGVLRAVLTPFPGFGGRLRLQLLDVNGDGSLDLIVRAVIHGKRKKKVFDAITLDRLA